MVRKADMKKKGATKPEDLVHSPILLFIASPACFYSI